MAQILRPNFRKQRSRRSSQRIYADELASRGGPSDQQKTALNGDGNILLRIHQVWVENHTHTVWVITHLPSYTARDVRLVEIGEYREDEHAPLVRYLDEHSFQNNFCTWDDYYARYLKAQVMTKTVVSFTTDPKERRDQSS